MWRSKSCGRGKINKQKVLKLLEKYKPELERRFGVQSYLEDLFGRPVDLVTDKALRPELRPYVGREAIHV